MEMPMSRQNLILVIILLVVALGGMYAYYEHQRDERTLDINIGEHGVTVD